MALHELLDEDELFSLGLRMRCMVTEPPPDVDVEGFCYVFEGAKNKGGYGVVGLGRRELGTALAHRVSYEMTYGPIPEGLDLDHLCCTKSCINELHLEAVTKTENQRRQRKKYCRSGRHRMVDDNVLHPERGMGWRRCRACKNESQRDRRARTRRG